MDLAHGFVSLKKLAMILGRRLKFSIPQSICTRDSSENCANKDFPFAKNCIADTFYGIQITLTIHKQMFSDEELS